MRPWLPDVLDLVSTNQLARLAGEVRMLVLEPSADLALSAPILAFISSTVHVTYAHIRRPERYASDPKAIEDVTAKGRETARDVWQMVEDKIAKHAWAAGENYSVADPYLFTMSDWLDCVGIDIADYPKVADHYRRMKERPAVKQAMEAEARAS